MNKITQAFVKRLRAELSASQTRDDVATDAVEVVLATPPAWADNALDVRERETLARIVDGLIRRRHLAFDAQPAAAACLRAIRAELRALQDRHPKATTHEQRDAAIAELHPVFAAELAHQRAISRG